jgi:hypothetical protein
MKLPKKLSLALLLSATVNAAMQALQVYRYSYDAYTHMFFADHYRRDWFSLWDARWYGGFFVTTYPPLSHQLMGLLSYLLNIETSYQVLAVATAVFLTYSAYLYSRVLIGEERAQYAALLASFLPATGMTLNSFGQLPTALSTALSLIAAYSFNSYLFKPSKVNLLRATLWTALSGFTHHFTLAFFTPIVILTVIVKNARLGRTLLRRTLLYCVLSILLLLVILRPFVEFAVSHPSWEEIPHATRDNLFTRPEVAFPFFWGMYSFTIFLLPNAFVIAFRDKEMLFPLITFLLLFILGLGGTTPIPAALLGGLWKTLTYDRFAFWATLTYLLFLAIMASDAGVFLEKFYFGDASAKQNERVRNLFLVAMVCGLAASFILSSSGNIILRLQPPALSDEQLRTLAQFLDENREWKYITLGLGNQRILLSTMTVAPMFDGGYNLAKALPIFTESSVESVDAAKHYPGGIDFLEKVITSQANNGLKYVVVADEYYKPTLRDLGLRPALRIEGSGTVEVWEVPYAVKGSQPPPLIDPFTEAAWSIGPVACLLAALALEASGKKISLRRCVKAEARKLDV